ncbi:MAG: hypothetical protein AABY22_33195 [Nanoarchaeota archaeon]
MYNGQATTNFKIKIMGKILSTKEIFRVTFNDGTFERLMKQSYKDSTPFYYRTKGLNFVPVDSSSSDLKDIIKYFEKGIRIEKQAKGLKGEFGEKIQKTHEYYLAKSIEFLDKLKKFYKKEVVIK